MENATYRDYGQLCGWCKCATCAVFDDCDVREGSTRENCETTCKGEEGYTGGCSLWEKRVVV